MNICKNCKWWVPSTEYPREELKDCSNPKVKRGYAVGLDEVEKDGILIEDDEGWGWLVGPEFGCIHWEK